MGEINLRFRNLIFLSALTLVACNFSSQPSKNSGPENNLSNAYDWVPANTKTVLWVGAHPDDEIYVAPILAELCKDRKLNCHLLVMTDGGKGHCILEGGCAPSVAEVRDKEMKLAAEYYGAKLEKPNFEDSPAGSPEGVLSAWNDSIGGGNKLLDGITAYVSQVNPDLVLTFDPRHGSSCHLDHRAVGRLVMAAVLNVKGSLNSIFFPQAYWATGNFSPVQAWAGNAVIIPKDGNVFLVDALATWSALMENMTIHASQFSPQKNDYIDAFHYAANSYRMSPLLNAAKTDMADPLYQNLCPDNDARWPGQ